MEFPLSAQSLLRSRAPAAAVTMAVLVMMLSTTTPRCRAAFLSPNPSSSLAKSVTATCSGASGCAPSLDQRECYTKQVCQLQCPASSRQDFPDTEIPLKSWTKSGTGVTGCQVSTDTKSPDFPATAESSNGLMDVNSTTTGSCTVFSSSAVTSSGRIAVSFWVLPACNNNCTLVNIAPVAPSSSSITVFTSNNKICVNSFCTSNSITIWTHIILQISDGKADIVVNGSPGGQVSSVPSLTANVSVTVGTTSSLASGDGYQLNDMRYYSDILTFRELQAVFTNASLQQITPESNCRCPHTHPNIKTGDQYTCVDSSSAEKERLEVVFFPPDKLLDGDSTTKWVGPHDGDFTLMVDLEQHYQVEKVEIEFQTGTPNEITVNLPKSQNNQLTCGQSNCSFKLASQNMTPGVFASHVEARISLKFTQPGQNVVVSSIAVTGRCNCNGNAAVCNTTITPYVCDCDISTYTQGKQCESCKPNRFHNTGQFDCQGQCMCNQTGAKDLQQLCDENGGACLCKDNVEGKLCDNCKPWTYDFKDTHSDGCLPCTCHQNGSVSCNPNDGTCTCKTNVAPPTCSQCKDTFYDAGPAVGPDVCIECGCNLNAVTPGANEKVCDKDTGQCACKEYVQGRTCNECKDGYYSLDVSHPKGCLKCACNAIGSINNICDKTTGQCTCENGMNLNPKCVPRIESVTPRYGPLVGGTVVTITGQFLGNTSQVPTIFVGNISHQVMENNISTIVFKTMPSASLGSSSMRVSWDLEQAAVDLGTFTFEPNPVLDKTDLPTVSMFTSGGCAVRFKGSNFKSVATPQIFLKDGAGRKAYGSCRLIQQYLQCINPDLSHVKNIDINTLRFGLYLDGVQGNDNLGPVQVTADPTLNYLGSYDLQYPFETTISITGSALTGGCDRNEVSILLGVVSCDIVSMSATEIQCEPPKNLRGTSDTVIMVSIGSNIAQNVGTLNYLEIYETSYFIGILCGIGAVILLVIVIIIFCRCRRRRKNSGSRQSQIHLMEKPSNGSYPVQNQYSELPSVSGGVANNGFQQNPIRAETVIREPKEVLPPTAREVDLMTDFLHRVEPSLWEAVKSAMVTTNDLTLGRVCTNKGNYARIIDGQFATERAGQKTQKKVTIKTLINTLPAEGLLPLWAGAALRECLRLHRHNDSSILSIIGLALDDNRFHVIYPFMENRTLKDHIVDAKKEFSVRQLVEFGLQVSEGLGYLHTKDLVHRDLATRNCMVNELSEVKISDASFSWDFYSDEYVYDSNRERYLPLRWMAPESLSNGYYDVRTDVWSLGVLLWELLTRGCLPFHEVDDTQVKDYITEGYMLGKPQNCSDQLYEVMKECWAPQNEHRPAISAAIKMLGDELTEGGVEQDDVYVNMGTVEGYYENQSTIGKPRRKAPAPPRA